MGAPLGKGNFDQDFIDDDSRKFIVRVCVPGSKVYIFARLCFASMSLPSFDSLYHMRPSMMFSISTPASWWGYAIVTATKTHADGSGSAVCCHQL